MTIFYEDEVRKCLNDVADNEDKEYALFLLEWAIKKRSFDLDEHDKQVRADVIDDCIEYFKEHAHEVNNHISARDFICGRLEMLKEKVV